MGEFERFDNIICGPVSRHLEKLQNISKQEFIQMAFGEEEDEYNFYATWRSY